MILVSWKKHIILLVHQMLRKIITIIDHSFECAIGWDVILYFFSGGRPNQETVMMLVFLVSLKTRITNLIHQQNYYLLQTDADSVHNLLNIILTSFPHHFHHNFSVAICLYICKIKKRSLKVTSNIFCSVKNFKYCDLLISVYKLYFLPMQTFYLVTLIKLFS